MENSTENQLGFVTGYFLWWLRVCAGPIVVGSVHPDLLVVCAPRVLRCGEGFSSGVLEE